MNTLESRFEEMRYTHFSNKQILKGYLIITQIQGPVLFLKIGWEILTTLVMYSPGINNFTRDLIYSIRSNWNSLSNEEQINVIAVLVSLNKHGKIDQALNKYY